MHMVACSFIHISIQQQHNHSHSLTHSFTHSLTHLSASVSILAIQHVQFAAIEIYPGVTEHQQRLIRPITVVILRG